MSVDVAAILTPYRRRSARYGDPGTPLADHLPMAVTALVAMGASHARAAAWAAAYDRRNALRDADADERNRRRGWRERIARDGAIPTVAAAVERLGDGLAAAAFHPVIRTAYAVERGDDDDLASALESWEREYLPLPAPAAYERGSAMSALARLAASPISRAASGAALIAGAMQIVADRDGFADIAAFVPVAGDLDQLAVAAGAAFAAGGNFTALHVMTGTHAMRVLRGVTDMDALMPAYWRAFAAATIVAGSTPGLDPSDLAELRSRAPRDWSPLLAEAVAHDDEHVIKAMYTAWRCDHDLDDAVFRAAAASYVQRKRVAAV